jgi:hypothetical protein
MADAKEILQNYIYPNLDIPSLIPELKPRDKGNYYRIECPECRRKEAYIKKDKPILICNRLNKCGYKAHIWRYILESRNFTKKETLEYLAQNAGVDLNEFRDNYSNYTTKSYYIPKPKIKIKIHQKLITLENTTTTYLIKENIQNFDNLSLEEQFQTIITFIYSYSLKTDQKLKNIYYQKRSIKTEKNIGFLSQSDITKLSALLLKHFPKEKLYKFGLFSYDCFKYNFSSFAVIPSFDIFSNFVTAIRLRNIYASKIKELEISYHRILNPLPYPLNRKKLQKFKTFYFTEGHIDGLSLGVENFVSIEGVNSFNPYNLGLFLDKEIIIAFDRDKAGQEGAKKLASFLDKLNIKYKFLVWDKKYGKDINELKKSNLFDKVSLQPLL